ncbi:MAG: hypothetical protein Q9227_008065 [Pyrenula ochraceoflavens]
MEHHQKPAMVNGQRGIALSKLGEIQTEYHLSLWAQNIEDELLDANLEDYQLYLDQLDSSKARIDGLLSDTDTVLDTLAQLSISFQTVEAQTSAFQAQSQGLLEDQARSEKLADEIRSNLRYYEYLEVTTKKLNAPSAGNFVQGKDFSDMLIRLDECIDYMQSHPEQKEAEIYRSRYRLLLTRALTLIRGRFVNALRETAAEVSKRIADRQLNDTTMSALLYAKFRVNAPEMKELGLEIQKRAAPPADADPEQEGEYQSLMSELHTSFAATRGRLILPLIHKKLGEISQAPSTSEDVVTFARASISYVRGICLDEFELWGEWFHGQRGVYDFLESICEPLYDYIRPKIIHETNINKLCQLCTMLQTRYMHDPEDETDVADPNQLDFAMLVAPALEDTQTRLVFRTQNLLRNEIELFKPRPEDLEYPRRKPSVAGGKATVPMSGRRSSTAIVATPTAPVPRKSPLLDGDSGNENEERPMMPFSSPHKTLPPHIYPTLRICIQLLSRLYRLLHSRVFDDLAHQIVHQTTLSLHNAAAQISATKPDKPSPGTLTSLSPLMSSHLFLLTHLLLLKHSIIAFDIDSSSITPDVSFDFSNLTTTFFELRHRGSLTLLDPRNLARIVSEGLFIPRVVETMLDAKAELDARLREIIGLVVNEWAARMTEPLDPFLVPTLTTNSKTQTTVKSPKMDTNNPAAAASAATSLRALITAQVLALRQALDLFIDDQRTKITLLIAVMERVTATYESFLEAKGVGGGRNKGKGREGDVWDLGSFEEWIEGAFGVRGIEEGDGEIGENSDDMGSVAGSTGS